MNYMTIEIKVVENGYMVTVSYQNDDELHIYQEFVFNSRNDLYKFLEPLLEIGTEKAGDDEAQG